MIAIVPYRQRVQASNLAFLWHPDIVVEKQFKFDPSANDPPKPLPSDPVREYAEIQVILPMSIASELPRSFNSTEVFASGLYLDEYPRLAAAAQRNVNFLASLAVFFMQVSRIFQPHLVGIGRIPSQHFVEVGGDKRLRGLCLIPPATFHTILGFPTPACHALEEFVIVHCGSPLTTPRIGQAARPIAVHPIILPMLAPHVHDRIP